MSVALARLQDAGLRLTVESDKLFVSPAGQLTDELRALIRSHRPELLGFLQFDTTADYPAALQMGTLVICHRCRHFESRPNIQPNGWCHRYQEEAWALTPFDCPEFTPSSSPPNRAGEKHA